MSTWTFLNSYTMLSNLFFKIWVTLSCLSILIESQQQFCYDDDACGPKSDKWGGICQTGKNQSPIDIKTSKAENLGKKNVVMSKELCEDQPEFTIENDGKTIEIKLIPTKPSHYILGGEVYVEDYTLGSGLIDFHWGKTDEEGAQHTIDGKTFALEMHIVWIKTNHTDHSLIFKLDSHDTLIIQCVLFEIGENDNPDLEPIIKAIPKVQKTPRADFSGNTASKKQTIKEKINIFKLIPAKKEVYRYHGSIDIPNPDFKDNMKLCEEIAVWDIFTEPLKVSKKQMAAFRSIEKPDGKPVLVNSRPVQELREQKIQKIEWDFKCKKHLCKWSP